MQKRYYKTPVTLLYRETEQITKADARIAGAQKHQGGVRRLVPPCTPREAGHLYGNYFVSRKLWDSCQRTG